MYSLLRYGGGWSNRLPLVLANPELVSAPPLARLRQRGACACTCCSNIYFCGEAEAIYTPGTRLAYNRARNAKSTTYPLHFDAEIDIFSDVIDVAFEADQHVVADGLHELYNLLYALTVYRGIVYRQAFCCLISFNAVGILSGPNDWNLVTLTTE